SMIRLYIRSPEGVATRDAEFYPFFHLSESSYLVGFSRKHWVRELSGTNHFHYLCAFHSMPHMWEAVRFLIERYNAINKTRIEHFNDLPILHLRTDALSQFLIQTGITLFKGMEYADLYRMQLDIETYFDPAQLRSKSGGGPERKNAVILVSLMDNRGWSYMVDGRKKSEADLLKELVAIIRDKDPDVIEGHNIYGFDLPHLMKRCELNKVEFAIGRDGSVPRSFDSRAAFAERSVEYNSFEIAGRHVIDTLLLVQSYDVSKRSMDSYGLKYAAKYFGFAKPDRVYIPGKNIAWYWDHDPDTLIRYAMDDVDETRQLSDLLSPGYFYLAKMVPSAYGTLARTGSAMKIENILLREYVSQKHSVPKPQVGGQISGGYTDVFYTGVLGPVLHLDVESLYPSIMLRSGIAPLSDELKIFSDILRHLTTLRLSAKKEMRLTKNPADKSRLDAMQSSYKILINSFYGYLGYGRALFNDYAAADRITIEGQEILRRLIARSRIYRATVVEVDTDGIFLVPPATAHSEKEIGEFIQRVKDELPEGINLGIEGRFKKILSYKMKNYALLEENGSIKLRGSSLISRAMERFGRRYITECVEALLFGNVTRLHELYLSYHESISNHRLDIVDFLKRESLKLRKEDYLERIESDSRNKSAAYEAAIAADLRWNVGDRVSYYITGQESGGPGFQNCRLADEWDPASPDENVRHYLKRLDEFSSKFQVYFSPAHFRSIYSTDDLFGFDPTGIKILTRPVEPLPGSDSPAEEVENDP
ncbi:MAG TPA: DNA polymerase domain-containing protein, partial [Bacteroidota bacterium]|nr:DNA polymerase domain-containing protein [Bacteroidota bacterium]